MTPQDVVIWGGAITGLLMGLARVIAFTLEQLGMRPADRRADRLRRLEEAEEKVRALESEVAICEQKIEALEVEVREERVKVDMLESILRRQGYTESKEGWQPPGGRRR